MFPDLGTEGMATGRGLMFGVRLPPRLWAMEGRAKISATFSDPTWGPSSDTSSLGDNAGYCIRDKADRLDIRYGLRIKSNQACGI